MKIYRAVLLSALALPIPALSQDAAQPPSPSASLPAVSPKAYERYVGDYALRPGFKVRVMLDGQRLLAQGSGRPAFELFPSGEGEFFEKGTDVRISFVADGQGQVSEFILHQGGHDFHAPRIAQKSAASLGNQFEQIDAMAASEHAKRPVGSITIGVVVGGQLAWTKSYGNADMEKKTPADQDTIYRIGSVTKMFTALMLQQLADHGTVRLSDSVEKYLPEVNAVQGRLPGAPAVTLFQLATHTSGMEREPSDMQYLQGPMSKWEEALFAALAHTRYADEPGIRFSYSNIGYSTLGAALARAAGTSYQDYLQRRILAPLGMSRTWLDKDAAMGRHLSKGYSATQDGWDAGAAQRELDGGRGYKIPTGALFTTVGDLAKFTAFLMGQGPETVLKRSALQNFQTRTLVASQASFQTGYGLAGGVEQRPGYVAFGHAGEVEGWRASLEMNLEQALGVIVLANSQGGDSPDIGKVALEALDLLSK